mgnify:CR=1 FL=1
MIGFFIGIILLIGLAGFFSGMETALISANIYRLKYLKEKGIKPAEISLKFLESPSRFLSIILVGTNLCIIIISVFFTYILIRLKVKNPAFISTLILTPVILIFCEIIPKRIARLRPQEISLKGSKYLDLFSKLLNPLVFVLERISEFISKKIVKEKISLSKLTRQDLINLVKEIRKEGVLESEEAQAIEDVFDFGEKRVSDVMKPISEVVYLEFSEKIESVLNKVRKYKFTRYPVVRKTKLIGMLNIFDYFYKGGEWQSHIRPIMKVGRNERLDEVFAKMQERKQSMCAVVKGNKIIGIVTLHDLTKEIVSNFL